MSVVPIQIAKTTLSQLIERACAGEEIIIAHGAQSAVKLVPLETVQPKRQFGILKGLLTVGLEFFEPLPANDLDAWET